MNEETFISLAERAGIPEDVAKDGWVQQSDRLEQINDEEKMLRVLSAERENLRRLYPDADWPTETWPDGEALERLLSKDERLSVASSAAEAFITALYHGLGLTKSSRITEEMIFIAEKSLEALAISFDLSGKALAMLKMLPPEQRKQAERQAEADALVRAKHYLDSLN
jgi:hypothetical protein